MTTKKQMAANQENSKNSTGPKTKEGKAKSSLNAQKHGLLSRRALMSGEDAQEYDAIRAMFREEFLPITRYEQALVDDLTADYWRLGRIIKIEGELLEFARSQIRHQIAKKTAHDAKWKELGVDDLINAYAKIEPIKHLEDDIQSTQLLVHRAEDTHGGAFAFMANNGDAFSKLGRYETRIRNTLEKLVEKLEERRKKLPPPGFYNLGQNSCDHFSTQEEDEDGDEV